MIYLDSSVALAQLLAEDRFPPEDLWHQQLISSRLLVYEVWNRIHARRLDRSHGGAVRALIGRVALLELAPPVLARALTRFRLQYGFLMLSICRRLSSYAGASSRSNWQAMMKG